MVQLVAELVVYGLIEGAVYSLLALGYSLVYGVGGIMNLSHGALYILTGYIVFWALMGNIIYLGAIILSIIITTLIGAIIYLIVIKPLQDKPMAILIITFALAMFIQQLVTVVTITPTVRIPGPQILGESLTVLGVGVTYQNILTIVASITIVVLFILFINKTKVGNAIRAISQDKDAAKLMGINVNRYLMYTLMISSFLAAVAAVVNLTILSAFSGWQVLTTAFSVVILGGLGSLWGSVIASYILGYITMGVSIFINPLIAPLVPVVVIVVMLIIRPQGLFGKKERS